MVKTFSNEFSWSQSRHHKFSECRRAYWFFYYRSWGGWEPDAPAATKELYVLKQLGNRFTWAGTIVHAAIRGALTAIRMKRPVRPQRVLERVHRVMRQDFVSSREKRQWRDTIRRDFNGLIEHEYDEQVTAEAWQQSWVTVRQALSWFFDSPWPVMAQELRAGDWLEVDNQAISESSHTLDGVKVFAVPDFAFRDRRLGGAVRIIEWKTGLSDRSHETQVVGSALFVQSRHKVKATEARASVVYLNDYGRDEPMQVDDAAVARFLKVFGTSVNAMRAVLAKPARNIPYGEGAFPRATNPVVCARCPFKRPCRYSSSSSSSLT